MSRWRFFFEDMAFQELKQNMLKNRALNQYEFIDMKKVDLDWLIG